MERYRVSRVLARGGMCEILEAVREAPGGFERRVAIKRLRPELATDEGVRRAFFDEARILSRMSHAHVVQIFDFGELEGRPMQVLELVEGADLARMRDRAAHLGESMSAEVALRIVADAAVGLDYAHRVAGPDGQPLSVVHRDVSPRNLLVSSDGQVKVIDFGVAFAEHNLDRTLVGRTKGTLQFMAPEQARGEPVDARADVFGLGCVLHWCLTGESPLEHAAARMQVYANEPPALASALPAAVRDVAGRALQPRPSARFESAQDFAEACWRALERLEVREGPAGVQRWARRFAGSAQPAVPTPHAVGDLFDIALLDESKDTGREQAPLRRFRTMVSDDSGATVLPLGKTVPVALGLDDPQTILTTDRAPAPRVGVDEPTAVIASVAGAEMPPRSGPPGLRDIVYGYRLEARVAPGIFRASHEVRSGTYWVEVDDAPCAPEVFEQRRLRARALSSVSAEGLAPVLECARTEEGYGFWVSEAKADGPLLALGESQVGLPTDEVIARLGQLAIGLEAAHAAKVVHGGPRPSQVLVDTSTGRVFLLGFFARDVTPDLELTVDAESEDLESLAPERRAGEPASVASDLYGLGVIGHLWLAGRPPEEAPRPLSAHSNGGLAALLEGLLRVSPEDRPSGTAAVRAQLERLRASGELRTEPEPEPEFEPELGARAIPQAPPTAAVPPASAAPRPRPSPLPSSSSGRRWSGPLLGLLGFSLVLAVGGLIVQRYGPAAPPIDLQPVESDTVAAHRRAVTQAMRIRGLEVEDLTGRPEVAARWRRCAAALDAGRIDEAKRDCAALMASLDEVPVSLQMLERALGEVSRAVKARARPSEPQSALEGRLERLREEVGASEDAAERKKLLRRLQELRVDAQR